MPRSIYDGRLKAAKAPDSKKRRGPKVVATELGGTLPGGYSVRVVKQMRRGHLGQAIISKPNGEQMLSIPIDGQGKIPEAISIARLMNVSEGDRQGKRRNVFIDV